MYNKLKKYLIQNIKQNKTITTKMLLLKTENEMTYSYNLQVIFFLNKSNLLLLT